MKQQGRTPARLPYISSLPHTHEVQSSCPSKKPFYMRGFICAHASRVGTRPRQSQSGLRKGPVYSCRTGQETPRTWDLGGGPGVSVAGGPGVSVARGSSGPGVYLKARAPEAEPKSTLRVAEAHWRVTVTESAGKEVCSVLVRIRVCPQGFVMVIRFPRTTTHVPRAGRTQGCSTCSASGLRGPTYVRRGCILCITRVSPFTIHHCFVLVQYGSDR